MTVNQLNNNILTDLKAGKEFSFGGFLLTKDGVFYQNDRLSSSFFISQKSKDPVTQELTYTLCYLFEGEWQDVIRGATDFQASRITSLVSLGIDFENVAKVNVLLAAYVMQQRKKISTSHDYNNLGWNDKNQYQTNQLIIDDKVVGRYQGDLDLEPVGKWTDWQEGVQKLVLPHSNLTLVLMMAFATVLCGSPYVADLNSLVLELVGDSSSGKTTALEVALSVFGNPDSTAHGSLVRTFASTKNSMMKRLGGLFGVMVGFDDVGAHADGLSYTDFIYTVGNNREKDRLTSDATLQSGLPHRTWVITTGEEAISDNLQARGGIYVRLIEVNDLQYTKSANHSEEVKELVENNYGFAASKFADLVLEQQSGLGELKTVNYDALVSRLDYRDNKVERLAKQLSLVLVATDLVIDKWHWQIDKSSLTEVLTKVINEQAKNLDYSGFAYSKLVNFIRANAAHFDTNGAPSRLAPSHGSLDVTTSDGTVVTMSKSDFNDLVNELKLPNAKTLLKSWKKAGLTLLNEPDRVYWRGKNKQPLVKLKVDLELD